MRPLPQPESELLCLPFELHIELALFLPLKDLKTVFSVCTALSTLQTNSVLWTALLKRDFDEKPNNENSRMRYKNLMSFAWEKYGIPQGQTDKKMFDGMKFSKNCRAVRLTCRPLDINVYGWKALSGTQVYEWKLNGTWEHENWDRTCGVAKEKYARSRWKICTNGNRDNAMTLLRKNIQPGNATKGHGNGTMGIPGCKIRSGSVLTFRLEKPNLFLQVDGIDYGCIFDDISAPDVWVFAHVYATNDSWEFV